MGARARRRRDDAPRPRRGGRAGGRLVPGVDRRARRQAPKEEAMTPHPHPRSPLAGLFATPGKFDFFQAVRLLERLATSSGGAAVGADTAPEQEAVHFRVLPALRFPAGPVAKAAHASDGPPELVVTFGGLTGP